MKLIDYTEKLIPLQAEADKIKLTLKRLHSVRKEMDRGDYLDRLSYWNNEIRIVHDQIYHLLKYKPISIEEETV